MDHGKIVSRAWDITWNNKFLWGLGFLAALASSSGSGGGGNTQFSDPNAFDNMEIDNNPFVQAVLAEDPMMMLESLSPLIMPIAILMLIGFLLWFVSLAARAGLVSSVNGLEEGMKTTFGDAFSAGMGNIGRLFAMKLVVYLPLFFIWIGIAALFGFVFADVADGGEPGAIIILVCPLICLLFISIFPAQFTDAYAYRAIVLRDMGVMDSIAHGWQTFRNNLKDSLLMGVLFGLLSAVIGGMLALIVTPISLIMANPIMDFFLTGEMPASAGFTIIGGSLLMMVVLSALLSVVVTWQSAGFTLAYRELTGMMMPMPVEKTPEDVNFDDMI